MSDLPFVDGKTIVGFNLVRLIYWFAESVGVQAVQRAQGDSRSFHRWPKIMLPPVQRTAVWRPKQVVDLWDSVMRGLPIGMFYLTRQDAGVKHFVASFTGNTREETLPDVSYALLDGQQRIRALLLGIVGFSEEKRCLWVDLGNDQASRHPVLRITSKGQPFGYDARTGNKFSLEERKAARNKLEKDGKILHKDGKRKAYDRELFDEEVTQCGKPFSSQPLLPHKSSEYTYKLCELLHAWQEGEHHSENEGIAGLRTVTKNGPSADVLICLHKAFKRIEQAEVALLSVDPKNFLNETEDLLQLFDRIGAGGTPLSVEERLYSIYKYHWPRIRNAVDNIHKEVGRVLPATKIAATAIRIAYAQTHKDRNDMPDVAAFSKMMRDEEEIKDRLSRLIPPGTQGETPPATLLVSFQTIKNLLSYNGAAGDFWIPDVLLASLPPELWQVLTFWAVTHLEPKNFEQTQEELVRFALFWHLCVLNNEKAARWAFAAIKESKGGSDFPGEALYRRFIGNGKDACAHKLISPKDFSEKVCKGESSSWRSYADRFVVDGRRDHLLSDWWNGGRKMLPWLQRTYIQMAFPHYEPLSEHEDDLPYDVDHLCPSKDWGGDDWRNFKKRLVGLDENQKELIKNSREVVGGGIGNLRLIEFSQNREDQADDVSDKMQCILGDDQPPQAADLEEMAKFAFAPEHRGIWKKIAYPGSKVPERKWDEDRLKAFQKAVEWRAAWLYERFYQDLGYEQWINGKQDS